MAQVSMYIDGELIRTRSMDVPLKAVHDINAWRKNALKVFEKDLLARCLPKPPRHDTYKISEDGNIIRIGCPMGIGLLIDRKASAFG